MTKVISYLQPAATCSDKMQLHSQTKSSQTGIDIKIVIFYVLT
jgi:hypothetical protein